MNVSTVNIKKHGRSSLTGSNLSLRHHNKNQLRTKEFQAGNDNIKYRKTKLTQIDVNSSNYAEIIRLTSLLDEAYAKINNLTSENKKLLTNQRVQERALKNTNELVGDYPKTIEKLMEDIRILKAQNKKYVEKLVSIERSQSKKVAIQNSTDNNYELKEKNHKLHEELEKVKQKMVTYEKNNENYQKIYDQLIKRSKLCKEKVAENKILIQKNQKMEKDIVKLRESYEILKKRIKLQGNNSNNKKKSTSLKYGLNKDENERNSNDHDSIRRSRDTLNKKIVHNEINKPKKELNSNEVRQVDKKHTEKKQKSLKPKLNFNNPKENNTNDRNNIKKSNNLNISLKSNNNESEENYKEIFLDDFDAIEDEDQKFFIPSQEESLKPSTLYKPNLYYSANCSPEPEIKNDKDNLNIDEVLNEEKNDNENENDNVNDKNYDNNNENGNNNNQDTIENANNTTEIVNNNNDNTIGIDNNNKDNNNEIDNNNNNNNNNNNSYNNNNNNNNNENSIEIESKNNDDKNNEIDNNKNKENDKDIINENINEDNNSNNDTNNEYSEDGNYYSDKFEEISFIEEKTDTEIPSSETTKSESLDEKINQDLDNSPEIVEESLEANKNKNNNGASIFDDQYYDDLYNDYTEENKKLNDSILNIDEYIKDIPDIYKSHEENMSENNKNMKHENNDNISYSNMDEIDDDDSLSFNNYNILDLLK